MQINNIAPHRFSEAPLPIAIKDKGLRKVLRRMQQLKMVLFSEAFRPGHLLDQGKVQRYSTDKEVHFYKTFRTWGLQDDEKNAITKAYSNITPSLNALVVGCGAGREAFGLENLGFQVVAIDEAPKMINAAKEIKSAVQFYSTSLQNFHPETPFDLIFVSSGISGHIQGGDSRINFFKTIHQMLSDDGLVIYAPDIMPLSWLAHYQIASQLLRLRWLTRPGRWQPGDTARSFLGRHNNEAQLFYFHFYQSENEFQKEVHAAHLEKVFILDGTWCLRTSKFLKSQTMSF